MSSVMKFDIPELDGKISFNIWKFQMMVVLTQYGLKKALGDKTKMPATMTDERWEELDEKAPSAIQLFLAPHVSLRST